MVPRIGIVTSFDDGEEDAYGLSVHYVHAVWRAGGLPILIPCLPRVEHENPRWDVDGLLFPGGVDVDPIHYDEEPDRFLGTVDPVADQFELALCRQALAEKIPILGICRGSQLLNVAAGGTLYQDIASQTGSRLKHRQHAPDRYPSHGIDVVPGSRLSSIVRTDTTRVNSFHHQAVKQVAAGFQVAAVAADGLVEAIERKGSAFALGVQWHPERMGEDPASLAIFQSFVAACGRS